MLIFEERKFFCEQDGPLVRDIQTREAVLATLVEGILGKRDRVAAGKGAKDFADVVQVLAEGITRSNSQLLKQVVSAEFRLEGVVVREAAIGAVANYTLGAVFAAKSSVSGLSGTKDQLGSGAGSYSGRHQVREVPGQISNEGVGVN